MKKYAKVSVIISLIFSILACSIFSTQTNKPSEITLTDEKPLVVLDTGNSEYPRIALFKGGEVIVPDLDVNQNGEIVDIQGATFITPDGKSIYIYFENGMPVRAIVDEHLIQFENFTGDTVDITFVSPDGTVTKEEKVPFDSNQIPTIGSHSNAHLASMVRLPNNEDIDWLSFAIGASSVFFCIAAATAVIVPTAGTATVILGAGCASLAYATYLAIANKEPPIMVEKADIAISGAGCVHGITQKNPIAVKDCAEAVIDIVEVVKKETQETEQKLVTMVGADPNNRQELVIQAQIEPESQTSPNISYEDFASIVDNLWLPSGEVSSECNGYSNGGNCKVKVQGTKTERCSESVSWYFQLFPSAEEASQLAKEYKCTNDLCNEFPGSPSGEFEIDITGGVVPNPPDSHLALDAYYQQGPIIASGFMFSCGKPFPDSWSFNQSDGIAFITPVRNWLHDLTDK